MWLGQKFPAIYAMFARFHSWPLPRPWWISSTFLRSVPLWFILILSGCLCQDPHKWSAWIMKYAESQRADWENTCTWNINTLLHASLHIPWVCVITCRALILSCCIVQSCLNCSPSQTLLVPGSHDVTSNLRFSPSPALTYKNYFSCDSAVL